MSRAGDGFVLADVSCWRRSRRCATQWRVDRPIRFEHHRYLGDKRRQVVYDIDRLGDEHAPVIAELLASECFTCFAPDTLPEARNRGYRLWKRQRDAGD
jgi:hypothetical protein